MSTNDMPDGWEGAALNGWTENPAVHAARLGRVAHDAYAEVFRQWKVANARVMADALEVPVETMIGQPLPVWGDLAPELQDAWAAAALAAREAD